MASLLPIAACYIVSWNTGHLWSSKTEPSFQCVCECAPKSHGFESMPRREDWMLAIFGTKCLMFSVWSWIFQSVHKRPFHYIDVIMSTMASLITSLTIVYSTVYTRRRSQKTSNLLVTGLCARNSPLTGEVPAQRASNAENVSIWWRHHAICWKTDA